jgi:hypothetical protein
VAFAAWLELTGAGLRATWGFGVDAGPDGLERIEGISVAEPVGDGLAVDSVVAAVAAWDGLPVGPRVGAALEQAARTATTSPIAATRAKI